MNAEDDTRHDRERPKTSSILLEDGGVIIYDPEIREAWIQSDSPIELR